MWEGPLRPRLIGLPAARCRDTQVPPTLEGCFVCRFYFGGSCESNSSALKELELAFEALERVAAGGIALHQRLELQSGRLARHEQYTQRTGQFFHPENEDDFFPNEALLS